MVPLLTLVFRFPIQLAVGCVILALLPSALISTIHNSRRGLVDFPVGVLLEIPTVGGTVLGAWLTSYLPTWQLEILFSVMVIVTAITMLRGQDTNSSSRFGILKTLNNVPPRRRKSHAASAVRRGRNREGAGIRLAHLCGKVEK